MKTIISVLIAIGLCGASLTYFYVLQNKFSDKVKDQANIPNEKVPLYNGDTLDLAKIKINQKLFLIIYSDECGFCQDIQSLICENKKTDEFYFVMISDDQTLRQPICKENLNVFWGTMRFETISKLSANHLKPCVFIYDKLGRLDKKTFGSKSVEVVRKHLTAKI